MRPPRRELEVDVLERPPTGHLGEGALGHGASRVHDDEVVGEPLGLLERVGRDDDRRPLVAQGPDDVPHLEASMRIEAGCGLVEEEHLWAAEQGGGEGEPLLLAARQATDRGAGEVGHPQPARGGGHIGRGGVEAAEVIEQPHRLAPPGQAAGLQHDTHAGAVVGIGGGRIGPRDPDLAPVRAAQAHGALDRGGLAGAIGAEHGRDPRGGSVPGEPVEGTDGAVAAVQVRDGTVSRLTPHARPPSWSMSLGSGGAATDRGPEHVLPDLPGDAPS